jgi:hypothetical protein
MGFSPCTQPDLLKNSALRVSFQGVALMKGTGFSPSINHCKSVRL